MKARIQKALNRVRQFNQIAEIDPLARRYFTLNSFDGILTTLGIIIANFFAKTDAASVIITSGIGAATAVGISGFYGAYMTEKAERIGKLKKLEKNMGMSFRSTPIAHAHTFATFALAIIEGLSPFITAVLMILPFFMFSEISMAYYVSFAISAIFLFLIGMFLGKISRESLIKAGARMVAMGILCTLVLLLIDKFFRV